MTTTANIAGPSLPIGGGPLRRWSGTAGMAQALTLEPRVMRRKRKPCPDGDEPCPISPKGAVAEAIEDKCPWVFGGSKESKESDR